MRFVRTTGIGDGINPSEFQQSVFSVLPVFSVRFSQVGILKHKTNFIFLRIVTIRNIYIYIYVNGYENSFQFAWIANRIPALTLRVMFRYIWRRCLKVTDQGRDVFGFGFFFWIYEKSLTKLPRSPIGLNPLSVGPNKCGNRNTRHVRWKHDGLWKLVSLELDNYYYSRIYDLRESPSWCVLQDFLAAVIYSRVSGGMPFRTFAKTITGKTVKTSWISHYWPVLVYGIWLVKTRIKRPSLSNWRAT